MSQTITLTAEQAKAFNNGESIIIESPKRHNVVVAVSREGRIYRIINAIWDGKGYKGSFELLFPYTKGTSAFGYFHEMATILLSGSQRVGAFYIFLHLTTENALPSRPSCQCINWWRP